MIKKTFLLIIISIALLLACSSKKEEKNSKQKPDSTTVVEKKSKTKDSHNESRTVNIDSLQQAIADSLAKVNQQDDTTITSGGDSLAYQRQLDSLQALADEEYEQRKKEAQEKVNFINKQYEGMWNDARAEMQFLSGSRTATQVRTRAHELSLKASEIDKLADEFPNGDPRRKVLEQKADFYQDVSIRMKATAGNNRKMGVLIEDIKETLRDINENKDIEINY